MRDATFSESPTATLKMTILTDSEEQSLHVIRFAVTDASEAYPPAKITLTEQPGGLIEFSASGDAPSASSLAEIGVEVAEPITKDLPLGERLALVSTALRSRFETEGYLVQELPAADFKVTAVFDLDTGRVVGRQQALHGITPLDAEIAKRVNQVLQEAFQSGPSNLAAEIHRLVDVGDHVGAAVAVLDGRSGLGFFGVLHQALFEALKRIDVHILPPQLEREVRACRMAVAARVHQYNDAEIDAQAILDAGDFEKFEDRVKFINVVAFACFKRGEIETAIGMWKGLLASGNELYAADRGWICRNLANALPNDSPEAIRAARRSIDAFLEAGEKRDAATSMLLLSQLSEFEGPEKAIRHLNSMLDLIAENGIMEDTLRSQIYHSLAVQFLNLRSYKSGMEAALEAVKLLRGISGAERDLIASLNLASALAEKCSEVSLSKDLDSEAVVMEEGGSVERYVLARRVQKLFDVYDAREAEHVRIAVNKFGDSELISVCEVAIATCDPELSSTARLRKLEAVVVKLTNEKARPEAKHPAMFAIVKVLREEKWFDRAGLMLRKILADQPLNLDARDILLQVLWDSEAWGDAAIFTREQMKLHGELPGILWAHGKSLLEAGEFNGALSAFMRALNKVDADNPLRINILECRERALTLGATLPIAAPRDDGVRPILKEELLEAFEQFSKFISADKRMIFWVRPDIKGDYKWVSHPEKRAQDLFHTFLKARFLDRISIFEELDTGAGRLDIYLKMDGGLAVVVELKMCGFNYSSTYAAAGEGQIQHYMANRSSSIGYLLVLDARLKDNGGKLISDFSRDSNTIYEIFVDMRPRVINEK